MSNVYFTKKEREVLDCLGRLSKEHDNITLSQICDAYYAMTNLIRTRNHRSSMAALMRTLSLKLAAEGKGAVIRVSSIGRGNVGIYHLEYDRVDA